MVIVGSSGKILDTTHKNVTYVTAQAVVRNSLISNKWGKIYIDPLEYILLIGDGDETW